MSFSAPLRRGSAILMPLATICLALASTSGCLNPGFVNQLAGGSIVPLAPGDTPFVQVLVINATASKSLSFEFGWSPEFQGFSTGFINNVVAETQRGFLLACPVDKIGLGNPLDLNQPAIVIDGTVDVPASAFPLFLLEGRDFYCGDTVVLTVTDDTNNGYGIHISAGRIDGATQTGPFSGPDTFEIVNELLMSNGSVAPSVVP